jgi:hypothetical protein
MAFQKLMASMVAQAYNSAKIPFGAPQKRGCIAHSPCLTQQPNQKRRRSNNGVRFNCTLMIGSCAQNYDRTPIEGCTQLLKEEMVKLYREKLDNIPLLNWSTEDRMIFFEKMAAKAANQANTEETRRAPKAQAATCLEGASKKSSVLLQATKATK